MILIIQFIDLEQKYQSLLDPINAKITSRTKATLPVLRCGQCGDRDTVHAIAQRHGIPVIEEVGILTAVHYPLPIHLQLTYIQYALADGAPVSESQAHRVVSLPMYSDPDQIVQAFGIALQADI